MRSILLLALVSVAAHGDPITPHVVRGRIDLGPQGNTLTRNLTVRDGMVYASADSSSCGQTPTVFVVDARNPDDPRFVRSGGLGGCKANELRVVGNTVFTAGWSTMLRVFSTTDLAPIGEFAPGGEFGWQLEVVGNRAYISQSRETQGSVWIVDVTNPAAPSHIATLPCDERNMGALAVASGHIFYVNSQHFEVADTSDERNPRIVVDMPLGHLLSGVRVSGNRAFVYWYDPATAEGGGVHVFDISAPSSPALIGNWAGVPARDMALLGNLGFVATSGNGVVTLDLAPNDPVLIAQTDVPGYEISVAAEGAYLYVGLGAPEGGAVQIIEVADGAPPVMMPEPVDDARIVSTTIPSQLACGETREVSVTVENSGTTTWTRAEGYKLGANEDSDPFTGIGRVELPDDGNVAPGQQHTFTLTLTAPSTPGTYTTDWRMVHELVRWFGGTGTVAISVECSAPASSSSTESAPPPVSSSSSRGIPSSSSGSSSSSSSSEPAAEPASSSSCACVGTGAWRVPWAGMVLVVALCRRRRPVLPMT